MYEVFTKLTNGKVSIKPTAEISRYHYSDGRVGELRSKNKNQYFPQHFAITFVKPLRKNGDKSTYLKILEAIEMQPGKIREINKRVLGKDTQNWSDGYAALRAAGLVKRVKSVYSLTVNGKKYLAEVRAGRNNWTWK